MGCFSIFKIWRKKGLVLKLVVIYVKVVYIIFRGSFCLMVIYDEKYVFIVIEVLGFFFIFFLVCGVFICLDVNLVYLVYFILVDFRWIDLLIVN